MDALALELRKKEKGPTNLSKPMLNTQNNRNAPVTNTNNSSSSSNQKAKTVEFKVPASKATTNTSDGNTHTQICISMYCGIVSLEFSLTSFYDFITNLFHIQ